MTSSGSLCSGYGGLDLALELALGVPLRHAWHVEYDKHPSAILAHHWPNVPNYGDVKHTDWTLVEWVAWMTAGYPCQPFSGAGLRKGEDDPRHLWPGVRDAVRLVRPRNVLLENVAGHLSLGFGSVLGDLAALGYDTRWICLRAADAGAPHSRARVFVVATDTGSERHGRVVHARDVGRLDGTDAGEALERERARQEPGDRGAAPSANADSASPRGLPLRATATHTSPLERGPAPDSSGDGRGEGWPESARVERGSDVAFGSYAPAIRRWEHVTGRRAPRPTEPGRRGERLSPRFVEWMMGLPAGWVTDVPGLPRNAQLKALGNGVVPQQAALALRLLGVTTTEVAA